MELSFNVNDSSWRKLESIPQSSGGSYGTWCDVVTPLVSTYNTRIIHIISDLKNLQRFFFRCLHHPNDVRLLGRGDLQESHESVHDKEVNIRNE